MKIAIISPSAPSTHTVERKEEFEKGLATLKELGFEIKIMPHAEGAAGYSSAAVEDRLSDLKAAYEDSEVEAIVCANGGWTSSHLLSGLDWEVIKNHPKPICGFSDITVLLNAIYKMTGRVQLMSPMVTWGFNENDQTTNESFLTALSGGSQEFLTSNFGEFVQGEELAGILIGGNLVSLRNLIGTPYEPEWEGKIVMWEETAERTYSLDRELTHFKNAGVWDKIGGVIVGHLDHMKREFAGKEYEPWDVIKEHFSHYDFPVFRTELFGHEIPTMITLPVGGKIHMDSDKVTIE